MTMNELVKEIAKAEGKKSEVKVGDIREVLRILSTMLVMNEEVEKCLMKNGQRIVNRNIQKHGNRVGGRSGG